MQPLAQSQTHSGLNRLRLFWMGAIAMLMVLAMAGFAVEDMFVKLTSDALPVGQIIALLGAGGGAIFAVILRIQGKRLFSADMLTQPILLRAVGEVLGDEVGVAVGPQ